MRLLLHNFLDCNIKTVKNGYPLKIEAEKVKEIEVDYDPDFLRHMFNRIDYKALREAAETLGAWRCLQGAPRLVLVVKGCVSL
jgi:multifunctional methyltransferase subunit TRM112